MTWSEDTEREQEDDSAADTSEPEAEQPRRRSPRPSEPEAEQPEAAAEQVAEPAAAAAEEPAAEQPEAAAEEPAAAEPAAEQPETKPAGDAPAEPAKKDVVPGADLEPIAIGDERELTAEERAAREAEEEERRAREAAAAAAADDDETIAPRSVTVPADTQIQATGKRKSSVARVIVRAGDGSFEINDRGIEEYFKSSQHQALARQPLVTAGYEGSVDVRVRVHGGGISGQAGAVRHGVARALTALEPELRGDLKRRGMLTRDDRRKERKKAGLKKARKRPQFSKR